MKLTRQELDHTNCEDPNCKDPNCSEEIFLTSVCHPKEPPLACYVKATGSIRFTCVVCGKFVAEVAVATGALH